MTEEAVSFGQGLVGILTHARVTGRAAPRTAFVTLGAGLLPCVGPNRLYVHIARRLAGRGHPVLRFDAAGIGDSAMRLDEVGNDADRRQEIGAAFDLMHDRTGATRFGLIGICSGAVSAFQAALADPRAAALALANIDIGGFDPMLDQQARSRLAARYYVRYAAKRSASWRRFFSGRSNYIKIIGALGRSWTARYEPRGGPWSDRLAADLTMLERRGVELLLVTSEIDASVDYIDLLRQTTPTSALATGRIKLHLIRQADHTFTLKAHQAELLRVLEEWSDRVDSTSARGLAVASGDANGSR
jgi:hypothetical protein